MKDFIYTEKFDQYLKGKLKESDLSAMEDTIHQDPLLSSEVRWQQDIYHALGEERKLHLKNRLDQVPVNFPGWFNFSAMQWIAVISSLLLISAGTYYYYSYTLAEQTVWTVDVISDTSVQEIPVQNLPSIPEIDFIDEELAEENLTASTDLIEQQNDLTTNKKLDEEGAAVRVDFVPEIVRPEVKSNFSEEDQSIDYSDFEVPDKTLLEKSESLVVDVTVETVLDSDYAFHYQMYDQKLFLYGDFQGIPYKIIALNHDDRKNLFLHYKGDFYNLNQQQREITPLDKIMDSTIIKALNRLSR